MNIDDRYKIIEEKLEKAIKVATISSAFFPKTSTGLWDAYQGHHVSFYETYRQLKENENSLSSELREKLNTIKSEIAKIAHELCISAERGNINVDDPKYNNVYSKKAAEFEKKHKDDLLALETDNEWIHS